MRQSSCPERSGPAGSTAARRVVLVDGRERELVLRPGCWPGYRVGRYEWQDGVRASGLPATDKHVVGMGLAAHMDRMGNNSRPGLERLERELTLTRRTIIRSTRNLERQGFLDTRRSRGGPGQTNRYFPLLPVPAELLAELGLEQDQAGEWHLVPTAEPAPPELAPPAAPEPPLDGELAPDAEHDLLITAGGVRLVPAVDVGTEGDGRPAAGGAQEPKPIAAILAGVMGEMESRPQAGASAVDTAAETVYLVPPESLPPPDVRATHPESCTPGPRHARPAGGRRQAAAQTQPERSGGTGLRLTRQWPAELIALALTVISLLHVPTGRRGWLGGYVPAVEAIAELLGETGASPATVAAAIEASGPLWPCEKLGGLLESRVVKARKQLAARERADRHAAELDAAGSDWQAITSAPPLGLSPAARQAVAAAKALLPQPARQRRPEGDWEGGERQQCAG